MKERWGQYKRLRKYNPLLGIYFRIRWKVSQLLSKFGDINIAHIYRINIWVL